MRKLLTSLCVYVTINMKMRKIIHFLLVFIATAWAVGSEPSIRSTCKAPNIKNKQLKIEEIPIEFRNSTENRNEKQMIMTLTMSEDFKDCMDRNKFNLKINLKNPISGDVRVDSVATQHIVTVDKKHVGIESCYFDDQQVSDEYLMLLYRFMGSANKEVKEGFFQETIVFLAPYKLPELKVKNVKMSIEENVSKIPCRTYRRCFQNLIYYFTRYEKYLSHS